MSVSLPPRGRGTASNPHNRFAPQRIIASDDGWICRSTARSILIAAVNMAAFIATPGPVTPIGICRRGWISRPS